MVTIKKVSWIPPDGDVIKINTDGCSLGKAGSSGLGIVCNSNLQVLGVMAKGLEVIINYVAECQARVTAAEVAVKQGWQKVRFETDSKALVTSFTKEDIPWQPVARWKESNSSFHTMEALSHSQRSEYWCRCCSKEWNKFRCCDHSIWSHDKPDFVPVLVFK
ncbi:hypothetical protein FRX31_032196 [Thalictrum thalictroides]|uniref:RNase H type-1 domain-containing protein n=1 Tax=Thalictrum thalictroides TaxID=46969 RepID=A0A7J6V0H6_THATH|nr:hypothetical protein FRX31_032196 [Thalictrum thalictroides]